MNNLNSRRELFVAAGGGLVGFFVILLAIFTVFVVALTSSGAFVFGGGIYKDRQLFIVYRLVPLIIVLGSSIPPWVLGASWWRGLLAGIAAMGIFIFIETNGGQPVDYGLYSQRETLAYISAALVSVLIATIGRNEFKPRGYVVLFAVSVALAGLRLVVPEENFVVGIVASLLAWIILPLAVAFFTMTEQNGKNQ
jgi:hypothetical protein